MLRLLIPVHQNASKAFHPTVAAFYNPAPRLLPCLTLDLLWLFTPRSNVSCEAELGQDSPLEAGRTTPSSIPMPTTEGC
jgi:hypothetical protein